MSSFYGYKEELDALRCLIEGHHYYHEEGVVLLNILLHKFKDVLFYYDPIKPRYRIELPELILNYNYTLTFCKELLDTSTTLGRWTINANFKNDEVCYTDKFREIESKLIKNIDTLTK